MDQPARLQRHAVALRHLANTRLQPARAARLGTEGERDVLRHAERLEQGEMLEHHADPQRPGASRVAYLHRLALPADLAGIGTGHAVDDLHQRALAGAVLTEQGVDLAGVDAQVDAVVGQATRITLADPAQFEARRREGGRCGHGGPDRLLDDAAAGANTWPGGQESPGTRLAPGATDQAPAPSGTKPGHAWDAAAHLRATLRRTRVSICRKTVITTLLTELSTACREPIRDLGKPPAPIVPAIFATSAVDRKQPTRQAMGATWQGIFSNTLPTALSTRYRQPFGGARQDDLSRPSHGSAESLGQPRRPASGTVCQQLFHRKPAERECP